MRQRTFNSTGVELRSLVMSEKLKSFIYICLQASKRAKRKTLSVSLLCDSAMLFNLEEKSILYFF